MQPQGALMQGLPNEIWSDPSLDGKYRFERTVASGAMAVVVVARHLELDEKVAIKFLSPEALRSQAAVTRFRREARAAAKIKNQHVVRIIDVTTTQSGIPYFVMEYLDGMDLERVLKQYPDRRVPFADAIDFVLQASEAIIEGHSLGIVHRDLKPANLFSVDRGDGYPLIKVLDFGISKFTTALGDVERTDQHEILGSPRYMSPEQIASAWAVDHRTDIWALGVILYEAIAGCAPFRDELIPELWRKIRQEAPEPLSELRADCPEALSGIVLKCLNKDPAKRFADLSEFASELAPFAPERSRASIARIRWTVDSHSDVSTRPSSYSDNYDRPATNPKTRFRRKWIYASAVATALSLALGVTWQKHATKPALLPAQVVPNKVPPPLASPAEIIEVVPRPTLFSPTSHPGAYAAEAPVKSTELDARAASSPRKSRRSSAVSTARPNSQNVEPNPQTREVPSNSPAVAPSAPPFLIDPIDDREKDLP